MTHSQAMLDTFPRTVDIGTTELSAAIDALLDCANTCTQCADACMSEPDIAELGKCISGNLDCADVCTAAARVVSRQTDFDPNFTGPLLEASIAACRRCAEECEMHAQHMDHCRICAEQCRWCEEACNELLDSMR